MRKNLGQMRIGDLRMYGGDDEHLRSCSRTCVSQTCILHFIPTKNFVVVLLLFIFIHD